MEKLSLVSYGWKCVLGAEVVYLVCLVSGLVLFRSAEALQLHHTIFEMLPGFTWLTPGSVVLGSIYVFVFSWIIGWYHVWMHNSSLVRNER